MTVSAVLATMLVAQVIPALTSLATKCRAAPRVKQLITALLASASGAITSTTANGTPLVSLTTALLALGSFIAASVSYVTLYKPNGIVLLPDIGLGAEQPAAWPPPERRAA